MTEETAQIFDAPYKVYETRNGYNVICTNKVLPQLCWTTDKKDANRLASLPELYDKLMWAVVQKCPDAFLTLDECRLCPDKKCKYREIVKLLKKVRDGK